MIKGKKCILLVDDDAFIATGEAASLKKYGYEVLTATTGKKAIEMVRANPDIDLILMDINLGRGKMEGTEAARIILESRILPVIFLSNRTEQEIFEKTEHITSYGYVVKGSGTGAIDSAVKVALSLFEEREIVQKQQDELSAIIGIPHEVSEVRKQEILLRENIEKLERQKKEQDALLGAARAVMECHTFEEAAQRIFDACCEVTGAVSGYVALMSEETGNNEVLFLEAGGLPCDVDPDLPMPIRGLRAVSYNQKRTVYENDFMNSGYVDYMPDGHVEMRNVMFAPLILEGRVVGVIGLANKPEDFTEQDAEMAGVFGEIAAIALYRSWTEEKLSRSLDEKQALYSELQHRVKNSIAAIGNIIDLEKMWTDNEETKSVLNAVSSRVRSMSELYLMLYESGSVDEIKMDEYCAKVARSLHESYSAGAGTVELLMDFDPVVLDIRRAMPVGLILAELMTNAYKHSFPEERAGTVSVSLKRKDGRLALTVSDNGIGASDDELAGKGGSGLEIVRGLVDQIDGTMTMDGSGGMTVEIMFPEDD